MHILLSGTSGLIGSALDSALLADGHKVTRLVRKSPEPGHSEIRWNPLAGVLESNALEDLDAVIHLSGENIACRWNDPKKNLIRESRVKSTQLLCEKFASVRQRPKTLICASAIGYYGNRDAELLTEESKPGNDFLAEVCQAWEAATAPANAMGLRVVNLRFGIVLSANGGALAKMRLPFKLCLGGIIGPGTQYWSWISIEDVVGAVKHALATDSLQGPVNLTTPHPVTNRDFTTCLGKVLGRPTLFPMPAFAARLAFGEMADALFLASTKVEPKRLKESGYKFQFPELEPALRHLLIS